MPGLGLGLGFMNQGGGGCSGAGQSFNGTDQYAYVADNGALDIKTAVDVGATDFCISCKINSGDIGSTSKVLGKLVHGNKNGMYGFLQLADGSLRAYYSTSIEDNNINDNIMQLVNIEYHCLLRIDLTNSKAYYYIDGVLQNAGGQSFAGTFDNLGNAYEFIIGAENNADGSLFYYTFEGIIKDVRIYHKNVVPDLTELMAGEKLGDEVAWWCLPGLEDISDNSYDLTGVNL